MRVTAPRPQIPGVDKTELTQRDCASTQKGGTISGRVVGTPATGGGDTSSERRLEQATRRPGSASTCRGRGEERPSEVQGRRLWVPPTTGQERQLSDRGVGETGRQKGRPDEVH